MQKEIRSLFDRREDLYDEKETYCFLNNTAADEAEAYAWMTETAKNLGKDPAAYYLMFYRENEITQPKGHITIIATENEKNRLFYMDGNVVFKELSYSFNDGILSFEMEQNGYYITVKSDSAPTPITPNSPKTGDTSNVWMYLLTMSISELMLVFIWKEKRLRK